MTPEPKQAKVSPIKQLSIIWLIPIITVLIGAWMIYDYVSHQGPEITLHLKSADGIEAGKTQIKSRNVKLGTITHITLSDDFQSIIAKAQMTPEADDMLKTDTRFWMVKPRIGRGGVSGLETLLSGAYISLEPGTEEEPAYTFDILDTPPVAPQSAKGLRLVLTRKSSGNLEVGDPVLYEGFTVGRIEKVSFEPEDKMAHYQLFIMEPFDKLVRTESKFWINSGMKMQLNTKGFNLEIGSVESLLSGGISFHIPKDQDEGAPVTQELAKFELFDSEELADQSVFSHYSEFVMLFDESVRGLDVGAPVEYRGIPIGYVAKVPLRLGSMSDQLSQRKIPVLIRIVPARIFEGEKNIPNSEFIEQFKQQFAAGLRGTLKTGSLLTGALFIDLERFPDESKYQDDAFLGYPVFPTRIAGVAELQKKMGQFVEKINALPMEDTLNSITKTMESSNQAMTAFNKTNEELSSILAQSSTHQLPDELKKSLQELQQTISGYGPNSQAYQDLQSAVGNLNQTIEQLNPLIKQLNQKPNSVVFGKDSLSDPIPVGGKQ
ncbi:MAG: intermembrane transport protein PqiB [Vibrio sp.]